jgi:hypothetical protein
LSIAPVPSPSIVCKIVRLLKNALASAFAVKASADYTRPAHDGRVPLVCVSGGLGSRGSLCDNFTLVAHRRKRSWNTAQRRFASRFASISWRDDGVICFSNRHFVSLSLSQGLLLRHAATCCRRARNTDELFRGFLYRREEMPHVFVVLVILRLIVAKHFTLNVGRQDLEDASLCLARQQSTCMF